MWALSLFLKMIIWVRIGPEKVGIRSCFKIKVSQVFILNKDKSLNQVSSLHFIYLGHEYQENTVCQSNCLKYTCPLQEVPFILQVQCRQSEGSKYRFTNHQPKHPNQICQTCTAHLPVLGLVDTQVRDYLKKLPI